MHTGSQLGAHKEVAVVCAYVGGTLSNPWPAGLDSECTSAENNTCAAGATRGRSRAYFDGQRLLWFDEAPPVLQYNKYVLSGYRAGVLQPYTLDAGYIEQWSDSRWQLQWRTSCRTFSVLRALLHCTADTLFSYSIMQVSYVHIA